MMTTDEATHIDWSDSRHSLPENTLVIIVDRGQVICSSLLSQQEWFATQMQQKAERFAMFLTGKPDPNRPGFIHPWLRYSLKLEAPPLFVFETLLNKALDLITLIKAPLFTNNADFSTCDRLRAQIRKLVTNTPWVPRPVIEGPDERIQWISLAEFANRHTVWSGKVIALPSLKISRREVSVICGHVCHDT